MAGLRLVRGVGLGPTPSGDDDDLGGFPVAIRWLSLALVGAGGASALAAAHLRDATGSLPPLAVLALMGALVGAACLQLRFSYRDQFEALDLFDAVLAPAVFSLSGPVVVVVAAAAMALSEGILHTRPVKAFFNVAQWAAAAGAGSLCYAVLSSGGGATARNLGALSLSMVAVSVVNHGAMMAVFSLMPAGQRGPAAEVVPGRRWALGGTVNLALGLLLVAAIDTSALAMALFAVPLSMLHWANRGYAEGRADRARLAGLQRATHVLVGPLDPRDAIAAFLAEVRGCFGGEVAELTLVDPDDDGYRAQRLASADPASVRSSRLPPGAGTLAVTLLRAGRPASVAGASTGPAGALLREERWRNCLAAPLIADGEVRGILCVYNRGGLESFQAGELPVLAALAAELMGALEKATLVEKVLHQALHDALTGLPNRTLFHERVDRAIAAGTGGGSVAVMLLDLNRFKEVNDTLGHYHGDLLLQDVSRRIQSALRPDDTVARFGGDEFAIVIPRVSDAGDAEGVVKRVLRAVDEPFVVQGLALDVDVAVGIALYPEHGSDAVTLLQRADVAMYSAKASQRGFEHYVPANDRYSPRRLSLVTELRTAASRREFQVHYQPKSCLRTGRVTGVEALLRWHHPVHGPVAPDEFIPIAEQTGSIRVLTTYVLREALTQCATWRAAGLDLEMAVNLSVRSLLDADLPGEIAALLTETGVPSRCLTLELTETSMMTDPGRTAEVLARLHDLGLQLSIDDYGTGYSSLAYLRHLPVDEMKIDKSFVMRMDVDDDAAVIVRSTVDLGHNLGLRVVAEGVETNESWERLVALGCDSAQGYFVSRPVPATEVAALVERRSVSR